jgi:hypothetical protein
MKNAIKLIGIIAFSVVIGLTLTRCNSGNEVDNEVIQYYGRKPNGTLTITGLYQYNGSYIEAITYYNNGINDIYTDKVGLFLVCKDGIDGESKRGLISNGSATLKVWDLSENGSKFSGNGKVVFQVFITGQAATGDAGGLAEDKEMTFTNWVGIGTW